MRSVPNIMLLQGEDVGLHLGCYGDPCGCTPHLDRLAAEGSRYTHAFSNAPVCAPSRGGMSTGSHPYAIGNHHMRSVLRDPPRCFTHELREAGYHVSWPTKLDFNFDPHPGWRDDAEEWWKHPAPGKPFFVYENFHFTHESRMFADPPAWHGPMPEAAAGRLPDPGAVPLPPHLPDIPELRAQIVSYYGALSAIDWMIGERLRWLDEQGLRESTVVLFLSDHGRGLPREKRWCYDAGLHLPLIIRWPGVLTPGTTDSRLVSWVDIAPTILGIAGARIPRRCQGRRFLGATAAGERAYVFAGRDRMDGNFDKVRVARDHRWHYIRNDAPGLPWAQRQDYMEQQPIMPVLRAMHARGELRSDAAAFFADRKPTEELYDALEDPGMLRNRAGDPACADHLARLRGALEEHLAAVGDLGEIDEEDLVDEGRIVDQLDEYRSRHVPLPPDQTLGPEIPPTTQREARLLGVLRDP